MRDQIRPRAEDTPKLRIIKYEPLKNSKFAHVQHEAQIA